MSYIKKTWVNDESELSAENFNYMDEGIYNNQNIELIAISDQEPEITKKDEKYYNTTDNKIYTSTLTEWTNPEAPIRGAFYIVISEQSTYYYDGTTLVSVGGGTEDIYIQEEEPDDGKIWINNDEVESIPSEVVPTLSGNETALAPSVASVRKALDYSTEEVNTGTKWVDGKDIYRMGIETTTSSNSSAKLVFQVNDFKTIIKIGGVIHCSAGQFIVPQYIDSGNITKITMGTDGGVYVTVNNSAFYNQKLSAFIEYTKS